MDELPFPDKLTDLFDDTRYTVVVSRPRQLAVRFVGAPDRGLSIIHPTPFDTALHYEVMEIGFYGPKWELSYEPHRFRTVTEVEAFCERVRKERVHGQKGASSTDVFAL
jgi:hypothetical protein